MTVDLPCADPKLLVPLKRSAEFRALRAQLAGAAPHPVHDSWLDEGFHFFVFLLTRADSDDAVEDEAGFAVFAMHPDSSEPVSAVTVVPQRRGVEAEVTNLRPPGGSYLAPYPLGPGQEVGSSNLPSPTP